MIRMENQDRWRSGFVAIIGAQWSVGCQRCAFAIPQHVIPANTEGNEKTKRLVDVGERSSVRLDFLTRKRKEAV
jgi:hypothetical protein